MRVLSFDLGSRCGVSAFEICGDGYYPLHHSFHDLVEGTDSSKRSQTIKRIAKSLGYSTKSYDPRPHNFKLLARTACHKYHPDFVSFENVEFSHSLAQTQLWGSFRGVLWATIGNDAKWMTFGIGEIKKFATGRGDAEKEQMLESIQNLGFKVDDDNECDALFIGMLTCEHLMGNIGDKKNTPRIKGLRSAKIEQIRDSLV